MREAASAPDGRVRRDHAAHPDPGAGPHNIVLHAKRGEIFLAAAAAAAIASGLTPLGRVGRTGAWNRHCVACPDPDRELTLGSFLRSF